MELPHKKTELILLNLKNTYVGSVGVSIDSLPPWPTSWPLLSATLIFHQLFVCGMLYSGLFVLFIYLVTYSSINLFTHFSQLIIGK